MADDEKLIIGDDDWKEEARREKERLAEQETQGGQQLPPAGFTDLVNVLAMQALVGLGLVAGPQGERIPPSPELARHFIDLLGLLQEKTKNNLSEEERTILEQVVYDLRMRFVEMTKGAAGAATDAPPAPQPPQP